MAKEIVDIVYRTDSDIGSLIYFIKQRVSRGNGWTLVGGIVTEMVETDNAFRDGVITVKKYAATLVQYTQDV